MGIELNENYDYKIPINQNIISGPSNLIQENQKIFINSKIPPRGLNNIGATCYMNSVLQCLYHVYDLSNEFLKSYFDTQTLKYELLKKMPMTFALFDIIYQLTYGEKKSVNPKIFNDIISKNKSFKKYEANDSKNLVLYTLDNINKELNEYKLITENINLISPIRHYDQKVNEANDIVKSFNDNYNTLIGDLFHGLKSSEYQCTVCQKSNKVYQIFNIITCPIQKTFEFKYKQINNQTERKLNIIDCFKLEQNPVFFIGMNQLFCDKCQTSNDGICNNKICIAPKILILFLDRGQNNQFMCDVEFPKELDINEFVEEKGQKYKLIEVIEHLGQSGESGHFIACCKHFDGEWYIFSDSSVYHVGREYQKTGIPYLIFYEREN